MGKGISDVLDGFMIGFRATIVAIGRYDVTVVYLANGEVPRSLWRDAGGKAYSSCCCIIHNSFFI